MFKHGYAKPGQEKPTYVSWCAMLRRCDNEGTRNWNRYGGRGITVCDRWRKSFENFLLDMGDRPEGTCLDRIDNDGNYEPGNCRWVTQSQNARNRNTTRRLTFNGETKPMVEWASKVNMLPRTLAARLRKGWSLEKALTTPLIPKGGQRRWLYHTKSKS